MNIKKLCRGILFVIFIATIILTMIPYSISNYSTNGENQKKNYTAQNGVNRIVVNSSGIDVVFSVSSDNYVHVTCYENDRYKFIIAESDHGTLSVKEQDIKKFTIFELPSNLQKITVEVPKSFSGNIELTSERSNLSLEGINADNIEIKSERGKIQLNKVCAGGNIVINGFRDSISMVELKAGGQISALTKRENICFQNLDFGSSLNIENHRGNITGNIQGPLSHYSLTSEIERGESNLPADFRGGPKNIHIKTSQGDITVEFEK